MLQERDYSTVLRSLSPAAKLWLAMGLIFSLIFLKNTYYAFAVIAISIVTIIREKQTGLFKLLMVTIVILFISMYGIYGTMAPNIMEGDPVAFRIFNLNFYTTGIAYANRYYLRVVPLMCALFTIFLSIDITDLSVTMCKAGIPYKYVFTFVDSFQVITLLRKEMEQIRDAQRARGLNTEGNLIQRFKAFVPIIVPVVANSIIKIQDQAIAMETKGFNSECKKTLYREIPAYKWNVPVAAFGIALAVFSITYRILVALKVIEPFISNII
ncbi:MAG TPA: energy-coupling factor transporter transmembrane component T [Halanaerobiales bacterium]|nr:energy-coupling factor transporter transmembrane component T [Halanaerobiales bacterium]HPZ63616.1 energy-coupling factor transporter transmembrane component T [Halanaerobiales bacterium]HQD04839.1 energy-coupling factor transporter transmembrane component T [Halanaerobiales bacterium]